ncbi:M20/M25/M40 family metallo-hydrolase [Flavihumibacter fluvii]|uniref:M20/M25/M40 family metallo-hydrolase n=1 Tax=Flavihumibacter fluvii TaxID=2838157 RepID=UPI001BDE0CCC|nr:M20/M25/M40 family metallo-hydrolase [Flavihumibacter fluvii]ULQ50891.1 M20/M25/M40 family metallo-hydrolase [Flavihumibacter fluvii]
MIKFRVLLLTSLMILSYSTITPVSAQTSYEKYIDGAYETQLKEYADLVAIPSISSIPANKPDVERAADWIVKKLLSIGMTTAKIVPTDGLPAVYGSWDKAIGKPTVLIYAHYDVQPVKDGEWNSPPFTATIDNGKIFGRGASDDKSGVMIPIWAVEAMLRQDKTLPVNVKFVFEGEEESGSPNFRKLLARNKALFKADFALNADGGQFSETQPSIEKSYRGAAQLEFSVKTANVDAHSGEFGGKTPNAVVALSQIIASFYNKDGSVAVAGFYDKVLPLTTGEKEMIKKIPYDPANDMRMLGTTAETGDPNYSPLERIWYRPTLEIIGMQGGYTAADGYSNIIPGKAMARITCRLVDNQNGPEIVDLIVQHINKNCPAGATIQYTYRPNYAVAFKFPDDTKAYRYVADVLTKMYGKEPLQTATGGSVGSLVSIKDELGLYAYSLGFQQSDERAHGANEFFRLANMRKGQLVYCYYLRHLAEEEAGKAKK